MTGIQICFNSLQHLNILFLPTHLSSANAQKLCFNIIYTNFSTDILHSLFPLSILPIFLKFIPVWNLHSTKSAMTCMLPNPMVNYHSPLTLIHLLQWLTLSLFFQNITVLSSLLHHRVLLLFLISKCDYLQVQGFFFTFVFYLLTFTL